MISCWLWVGQGVSGKSYVYPAVLITRIDPSFQILHAKHSLEKILENLRHRSPEFDVVFWEGQFLYQ